MANPAIKEFFFLKSQKIGGILRLRALPGQTASDGSVITTNVNVRHNKSLSTAYPVGTVFGTTSLISDNSGYSAGTIYPMDLPIGDYQESHHQPDQDMVKAWNTFKSNAPAPTQQMSMGSLFGDEEEQQIQQPVQAEPKQKKQTAKKPSFPKAPKTNQPILIYLKSTPEYAVPTSDKDGFFVNEEDWWFLLNNIMIKQNTMMVGPQGTGKTELVQLACKRLGIGCEVFDMGTTYDPVSTLLGVHRLKKGGESIFDYSQFVSAIQKPGVILLDELSRAPSTSLNLLFPLLDNRRCLKVEMAGTDDKRVIPVHPDCVFIATANIGVEHTGTYQLDAALRDRFVEMEMDYIPSNEEIKVLMNIKKISKSNAEIISSVAGRIRSMKCKQEIEGCVSTRESLRAAQMVADGWGVKDALRRCFLPKFEGNETEGERSIIYKLFKGL